MKVDRILDVLATCPWLWWMGITPMTKGVEGLRRRAADRSIMLKLTTVLIVPLITAIFAGSGYLIADYAAGRVEAARIEALEKQVGKLNDLTSAGILPIASVKLTAIQAQLTSLDNRIETIANRQIEILRELKQQQK